MTKKNIIRKKLKEMKNKTEEMTQYIVNMNYENNVLNEYDAFTNKTSDDKEKFV